MVTHISPNTPFCPHRRFLPCMGFGGEYSAWKSRFFIISHWSSSLNWCQKCLLHCKLLCPDSSCREFLQQILHLLQSMVLKWKLQHNISNGHTMIREKRTQLLLQFAKLHLEDLVAKWITRWLFTSGIPALTGVTENHSDQSSEKRPKWN